MEAYKASMQVFKSKRVVVLKTHRQCEEFTLLQKENKVQSSEGKTHDWNGWVAVRNSFHA